MYSAEQVSFGDDDHDGGDDFRDANLFGAEGSGDKTTSPPESDEESGNKCISFAPFDTKSAINLRQALDKHREGKLKKSGVLSLLYIILQEDHTTFSPIDKCAPLLFFGFFSFFAIFSPFFSF
eukprot:COSAG06_NODE_253_length_19061_cov_33.083114_5_plen_123_part_00